MVIKRCQICNEVFNFRTSKQKYCKDCRPIAQREYKAQWHKENYEYAEKTNKPRICEYCGSINDVWFYKKEIMLCKSHYLEMYSTGMIRSDDEKGYKHNLRALGATPTHDPKLMRWHTVVFFMRWSCAQPADTSGTAA